MVVISGHVAETVPRADTGSGDGPSVSADRVPPFSGEVSAEEAQVEEELHQSERNVQYLEIE